MASVVVCTWLSVRFKEFSVSRAYYFVSDSNAILAVVTGFCGFMFFKNLQIPYSKTINLFGGATFGVLLIHANSDTMRRWLWRDVLDNIGAFSHGWGYLHAFAAAAGVFLVCACLELVRRRLIEKPFMRLWDRHERTLCGACGGVLQRLCTLFHIE